MPGLLADSDAKRYCPGKPAGAVEDNTVTTEPYSRARKVLHWLFAAVILWTLFTGFYAALAPVRPEFKDWVGWVNVSLTTLLIPLFAWRCVLAWRQPKARDAAANTFMTRLAGWVHVTLYLTMGVVLVTGVLMMRRPIAVFDWFTLPRPIGSPLITGFFHTVHIASCVVLAALVALHIAAVIKHCLRGTPVLGRML